MPASLILAALASALGAAADPAIPPIGPPRPAAAESAAPAPRPLSPAHQRWLEEEVVYIISDHEREAFLGYGSDALRDLFIERFWEVRDPTAASTGNELRDEHYRRIAEANRLFGPGKKKPGWKTPRGRIYIQLGPPQWRVSYPMERQIYPVEHWFYQGDAALGLPPHFNILFYQPYGAGEYELYDPVVDGPERLVGGEPLAANDRTLALGFLRQVHPDLMAASLSLVASDRPDLEGGRAEPSSGRLIGKIEDIHNRQPYDKSYTERIGQPQVTVEYSFRNLGMRSVVHGSYGRDGLGLAHLAIEIPPESLTLERYGDRITGALEVIGRVFTADGRTPVLQVDEQVEISLAEGELAQVQSFPLAYEDLLAIRPGSYRLNLVVRNRVSREFGTVEARFEVPARPAPGGLAIGLPLLVAQSRPRPDERLRPFAIGGAVRYPVVDGEVTSGEELTAVFEVAYDASAHAIGDELAVRYLVEEGAEGGEERLAGFERVRLNPAYDGGLTAGEIRLRAALPPGAYRLRVRVSGRPGESAERSVPFTLQAGAAFRPPWLYVNERRLDPGTLLLAEAEQALAAGDDDAAVRALEAAVDSPGVARSSRIQLAELRLRRREFAAARAAIEPLAIRPDASIHEILLLGLAQSGAGDGAAAIATLEKAAARAPSDTRLLNLLGEERLRAGQTETGLETLRRSLALDPEQAAIAAIVEGVAAAR